MRTQSSRELGAVLRGARARQHKTQQQIASVAGVERSWLARLEGGTENPTFSKLTAVLSALHLHLDISDGTAGQTDHESNLSRAIDLDALLARFDERP